ncbi:uncharacterized protein LOC134285730 [Aedes albopictus]|uniref:Secreted protein n=1 Tax=Aedes albopictus TaxID=7160 RepID=A0ABM1Z4Q9_AEDAL
MPTLLEAELFCNTFWKLINPKSVQMPEIVNATMQLIFNIMIPPGHGLPSSRWTLSLITTCSGLKTYSYGSHWKIPSRSSPAASRFGTTLARIRPSEQAVGEGTGFLKCFFRGPFGASSFF